MTHALTHLGEMPVEQFLRDYWQKKPLLIRKAFPDFKSPIDGDELAGLALEEEVESRLIFENGKTPWELQHGPFDENIFSTLPESHWTLLVQAVDQWVPEVHELLNHFRFIPNWRLDDIMVSYAPDQGSVGPHFDYYDVFLLQGAGQRRWRTGQQCDVNSAHVEGTPLNVLKNFEQQNEWLLEPGDMLYIPPGIAHWGIAEGESITYSIGFRAPNHTDIICELSHEVTAQLTNDDRFSDPDLHLQDNPGEISDSAVQQVKKIVFDHLADEKIAVWFGKYMTERKYADDDVSEEMLDIADWISALEEGVQLWRHPAARFAYRRREQHALLFADGQVFECTLAFAELVCRELEIGYEQLQSLLEDPDNRQTLDRLINQDSLLLDHEDENEE